MFIQLFCDNSSGWSVETETFAEFHGAIWTIQVENGFAVGADHVNVRWTVIVRIDNDTQVIKAQNGWHILILTQPNRLGYVLAACRRASGVNHLLKVSRAFLICARLFASSSACAASGGV